MSTRTPTRPSPRRPSGSGSGSTWMWWVLGVVVLVGAAAIIAVSSGGDDAKGTGHEVSPRITVEGSTLEPFGDRGFGTTSDIAIGETPPTLTGENLQGKKITFGDTGKPRMVLFVAHWCPHCQAEVPLMVDMAQNGDFDGVDVQTIATGTDPNADNYPPSAWLQREKWPFPVMADDAEFRAASAYGLQFYPYFVFVDADGKVVGRATGELEPAELRTVLRKLAAGDDDVLPS